MLVRVLLAPGCASCRLPLDRPLAGPVCDACWRGVMVLGPPWCERCGDSLPSHERADALCARCQAARPHFLIARSAGLYRGPLRELIHAFKYEKHRMLAAPLAAFMQRTMGDLLAGADAVVPVPLHPLRALRRGFNQADDLAVHLGLPVWRVLRRVRAGRAQAGRAREERAAIRGAFLTRRTGWPPRALAGRRRLCGAVVVLVDDVMTTGATLDACSEALLEAGVSSVRALTVARTVAAAPLRPPASPLPATARRR
jgi:ComF family protein